MSVQISKLDRDLLIKIEPLLSESASYQTSIPDELDFFDSTLPDGWFVASDENYNPVGFVRSFNQGNWSQGELFVLPMKDRRLVAIRLLENFLKANKFESGHRLRFDIAFSDAEFKSCIEQVGLNQKSQTFFIMS